MDFYPFINLIVDGLPIHSRRQKHNLKQIQMYREIVIPGHLSPLHTGYTWPFYFYLSYIIVTNSPAWFLYPSLSRLEKKIKFLTKSSLGPSISFAKSTLYVYMSKLREISIYLSIDTASPSLLSIMRRDACERIKVKNLK